MSRKPHFQSRNSITHSRNTPITQSPHHPITELRRTQSRRSVLRAGLTLAGGLLSSDHYFAQLCAQARCDDRPHGELLGVVPLYGDQATPTPFGEILGRGLDARLFTDLSRLRPDRLITPSTEVFIRTTAPPDVSQRRDAWTINRSGGTSAFAKTTADKKVPPLQLHDLLSAARPMGAHLIECSGNNDPDNFGLLSVVEWDGVPLATVLADVARGFPARREGDPFPANAWGVLVKGFDEHSEPTRSSIPGASWVFPIAMLTSDNAPFLAVRMNGERLPDNHGAPVRLVVPGWYGCSWIKWVDEIAFVGADEPVTSQMREFSVRTHQNGIPQVARDYAPPVIDFAATPVRVEKRRVDGRLEYRIVGIAWGGDRPVDRLLIRFAPNDPPRPLTICPTPTTHKIWSLWEYRWQPTEPGIYAIGLKAADPTVRTRRLDLSFYVRKIRIDEV